MVRVKYFGRHKGGAIRDGVLVAIIDQPQTRLPPAWSCDCRQLGHATQTR
jgi:hypothetical protein